MAVVPRKQTLEEHKPDVFEAARRAREGELTDEKLCEILLVGRCRKRFLERQAQNGRTRRNGAR